jgi:hypothetical protein
MGVWQGVAMDSLKLYLGPSCHTLLCLFAERAACSHLLPLWTPHAARLCLPPEHQFRNPSQSRASREKPALSKNNKKGKNLSALWLDALERVHFETKHVNALCSRSSSRTCSFGNTAFIVLSVHIILMAAALPAGRGTGTQRAAKNIHH